MKYKKVKVITLALCAALTVPAYSGYHTPISVVAAASSIGIVTATTLNVRTGAGTTYPKLQSEKTDVKLKKGDKVTVLSQAKGWCYVSFQWNKKTLKGYVSEEYLNITQSSASGTGSTSSSNAYNIPAKITAGGLRVRIGAGTTYDQLQVKNTKVSLAKGADVTIIGERFNKEERWYKISFLWDGKKKTGYVLSDFVQMTLKTKVKAQVYSSTAVKIQKAAGNKKGYLTINGKTVSLKNAKNLYIIKELTIEEEKWFGVRFVYGGKSVSGYILASQVKLGFADPNAGEKPSEGNGGNNEGNGNPQEGNGGSNEGNGDPQEGNEGNNEGNGDPQEGNEGNNGEEGTEPIDVKEPTEVSVNKNKAGIYGKAGSDGEILTSSDGSELLLNKGDKVTVYELQKVDGINWYLILANVDGTDVPGFIKAEDVSFEKDGTTTGNSVNGNMILNEEEFEQSLKEQGFPESYKPMLRELHAKNPYWKFQAFQTGLDWNTTVQNESKVGENLISNSKNIAWKSTETGAYSWLNDRFVPFDGSTWVTASKDAVAYYMDPRNFLTEQGIFQFELLSYQDSYQTKEGVENILKNTPMYQTSYSYTDETGINQTALYADTFIKAAKYSGVSPYHLATRVKQEVVTTNNVLSSSVSGKVTGYEGLYNFYNIGASHSTVAGGSVANGLRYAKNGDANKMYNPTTKFNDYIMIPWTSPYRSIIGGAAFIGYNYIQRGQNTVYLQKFNVTSTSTYSHQYMANVEGAASEAAKTFTAYKNMENIPAIFSIPVYQNMPATACPMPKDKKNPNNWLKALGVEGYTLTPSFNASKEQNYSLIVDSSTEQVTITGTTASGKASVQGLGIVPLKEGNNELTVTVTAENGDIRTYPITIVRQAGQE